MAIENIKELESSLKLEEGTLENAIKNEESVKVDLQEGLVIRTKEEEETLMSNKQNEFKTEFHTAGREIAIKEAKRALGLEFEGKTMDNLLDAHKRSVLEEAKVEPTKKIEELEGSLTKLRGDLTTKEEEIETLNRTFKAEKQKTEINSRVSANIKGDLTIGKDDALTLFNNKFQTELTDEGALLVKKDGKVLKDNLESPRGVEDIMKEFLTPFAKPNEGGTGGGDEGGSSGAATSNLEKFTKKLEKEGIKSNTLEFQERMGKAIADKTLVI